MFHLIKGLYENYNKKEEYSVLILGLDNAGKTTFLEQLKSMYIPSYKKLPPNRILPTVGQNIGTIQIPGSTSASKNTLLKFWDVGGQDSLRQFWSEYYSNCHGIIFVIDSCDKDRLVECSQVLSSIVLGPESDALEGLPILMLANKMDVVTNESGNGPLELVDIKEIFNPIAESLSARDSRVLPISAMTGEGVKEAIEWIFTRLTRNKTSRPPNYR